MVKSIEKPDQAIQFALLANIHLCALPLYIQMPVIVLLLVVVLSLWQLYLVKKNIEKPRKAILFSVGVFIVFSLLYSYGHVLGQRPGVALITLMTLLKLFEIKTRRDCYIVIFSCFFILATSFFQSQSVWLILYVFAVVISLLVVLITLSDRNKTVALKTSVKMASRYTLYAMPMMLILFVLFPRIPGPLWGLPADAYAGRTGLSEEMSPGSINRLISSSAIAFRVKFEDEVPPHYRLYWRGAVLSQYDGKTWRRDDAPARTKPEISFSTDSTENFRYTVTLEPTNLKWLLTLQYAHKYSSSYVINREAMLLTKNKLSNVISYSIESQTDASNIALYPEERYKNRLLPVNFNPKTIALAQRLLTQADADRQKYINSVLAYFSDNDFVYTLNPDLLGRDVMDDFLFNSKRGFCEHYASAFTYLMRLAGIPSRVVIGYQGGRMNPLDDYMIVRQSDAHAWTEVWITDHWQRYDPTAVVSPERVEQGVQNAGLELSGLPLLLISDNRLIKNIGFLYDSFQNSWNQWVINFDQNKQNSLLKSLGFEKATASTLIMLLVSCLTLSGIFVAWLILRQHHVETDQVQHYYTIFCRKLEKYGVHRRLNEGPVDFENRLYNQSTLDAKKADLKFIFKTYRLLHYGERQSNRLLSHYIKKVKAFK